MTKDHNEFWEWVERVRQDRDLPWYRVEELGGQGNGVLWRRYTARAEPTLENLRALSEALSVSRRELMERAGYIETHAVDDSLNGLYAFAVALTPDERREALEYLLWHFRRGSARRGATEATHEAKRETP